MNPTLNEPDLLTHSPRNAEVFSMSAQLSAVAVEKAYYKGKLEVPVLRGVDFEARKGEFVSIVGQSGSGKSTLMHLLGIDHERLTYSFQGRDFRLTDVSGRVIKEWI